MSFRLQFKEQTMKLKTFLNKYHTIIFDLDGVITSEEAYWDAAALTVYQQVNAQKLFDDAVDIKYYSSHVSEIRKEVFSDDKLISLLKNKGMNSNWDLAYVTYAIAVILDTKDFSKVYEYAENMSDDIFAEYEKVGRGLAQKISIADASRKSELWERLVMRFQEWSLGDKGFFEVYGYETSQQNKPSMLDNEEPIVEREKLKCILAELYKKGKTLAVATGRPNYEAVSALKRFGIFDYFNKKHFITYDYVAEAQKTTGVQVPKPHPYTFQKAYLGKDFADERIISGDFPKEGLEGALVVGDAGSDILGAQAMGADFCGVLTGVNAKATKKYFEEQGAEYILNSILDFEE